MEEKMLAYLKMRLDDYLWEEKAYGAEDRFVAKKLTGLLACKQMVEAMIQKPVNIQKNGEVTVGF